MKRDFLFVDGAQSLEQVGMVVAALFGSPQECTEESLMHNLNDQVSIRISDCAAYPNASQDDEFRYLIEVIGSGAGDSISSIVKSLRADRPNWSLVLMPSIDDAESNPSILYSSETIQKKQLLNAHLTIC